MLRKNLEKDLGGPKIMKMKILKSSVLVAIMSFAIQASAGGTVALSPFVRGDGDDHGSDVYTAYNFDTEKTKHNVALELLWRVSKAKGQDDYDFGHRYLRSTVTSPYKIDVGSGWDIGWSYRYYAPTDTTSQADGSYGSVGFRPWIVKDMGFLEFKARPSFYGYLQRHPSSRTTGTSRFSANLEVLPSFKITKNQVEISKRVKITEIGSIRGDFFIVAFPHDLSAA